MTSRLYYVATDYRTIKDRFFGFYENDQPNQEEPVKVHRLAKDTEEEEEEEKKSEQDIQNKLNNEEADSSVADEFKKDKSGKR